ncbi:hypothetical protein JCM9534A_08900 [Catenuloplanes indicus JCM 9534]|nr:hypothetical protein [Catenuloplanes indicus]
MWTLLEPVHAVTYFTPAARAAFEAAGLRGFWRGYFAGRAAPLGAVGAGPVEATFFGFAPTMVRRALPDVWNRAAPAAALAARLDGARASLSGLAPDTGLTEAAALLRRAAAGLPLAGRPLAAANADLPWPEDPLGAVWHGATLLREHRGDGHVAALLVAGLDGVESLVWRASMDSAREVLQPARGWTDEEWDAAAARLTDRGWLASGTATEIAYAARDTVERQTDVLAAGPWQTLGTDGVSRLEQLLAPLSEAALRLLPHPNPIVLPRPVA